MPMEGQVSSFSPCNTAGVSQEKDNALPINCSSQSTVVKGDHESNVKRNT